MIKSKTITDKQINQSNKWQMGTIKDTGQYINGLAFKPSDWHETGMPSIRIQNLTNPSRPYNRTTKKVDSIYIVNSGDILVSWSATLDVYMWKGDPAILNQHIFKVIPDGNKVTKMYLFYALKRAIKEMTQTEHLHGSTMKHINRGPFMAHSVPIPSLEEQVVLVAEIEKQFSRLDEAVANLKRVKANLKRYKAAVLKAAVEGRLVETEAEVARREGRDYETGEQLLQRILENRRKQWKGKGKYKEPAAPDTTDLPELPEGWVWITIGALLLDIEAGRSFKCEERPPTKDEVGVVKVSAVTWGEFDEYESKTCLDKRLVNDKLRIQLGDFLFSRANTIELVGACVIAKKVTSNVMLSDKILRFRLLGGLEQWVLYNLRSIFGREEIERLATGNQESMRNIGQERIRAIRIPLPPKDECIRIVAEIDRRLSLIHEIEIQVDTNLKRADRLRQTILCKAFRGELLRFIDTDKPCHSDIYPRSQTVANP